MPAKAIAQSENAAVPPTQQPIPNGPLTFPSNHQREAAASGGIRIGLSSQPVSGPVRNGPKGMSDASRREAKETSSAGVFGSFSAPSPSVVTAPAPQAAPVTIHVSVPAAVPLPNPVHGSDRVPASVPVGPPVQELVEPSENLNQPTQGRAPGIAYATAIKSALNTQNSNATRLNEIHDFS